MEKPLLQQVTENPSMFVKKEKSWKRIIMAGISIFLFGFIMVAAGLALFHNPNEELNALHTDKIQTELAMSEVKAEIAKIDAEIAQLNHKKESKQTELDVLRVRRGDTEEKINAFINRGLPEEILTVGL